MEPNEHYYNQTEACRKLHCYPEEFRRLCRILSIVPQSYTQLYTNAQQFTKARKAPWNKREKYISQSELEQLQELRGVVPDAQDQQSVMEEVARLRQEIAALQQQVQELHVQRAHVPTQLSLIASSESPRRPAQCHSHRPVLPDGWVSLDGFCRQHAIARSTVDKAIATGRLPKPHRGEWQEGRAIILSALDEEMQAAILARYGRDNYERSGPGHP